MPGLDQEVLRLVDKVGGLTSEVKNLRETWGRQDQEANNGRRRLHEKFDELKDQIVDTFAKFQIDVNRRLFELEGRVDKIKDELTAIKPTFAALSEEHHQGIGSKRERGKIWGTLMGLVTLGGTVGAAITELVHWVSHAPTPPPH
jgi:hypothetical protein